ncbi:MAG: SGNH/GDSL hydrolase family protein [Bacteroides sp.]|nr:SGNH/GDSL hydrolase family protein [Bacteroides sp.]
MKSHYASLWLLITIALALIVGASLTDEFSIGAWTPKKAPISELFSRDTVLTINGKDVPIDSILMPVEEPALVAVDSVPKTILLFGDSMTFNLALRLERYSRQNGHRLYAINWDSSNTKIWAETDTLTYYLNKFKPDYVFISLGSNEVYFKNPRVRMPYVQKILSRIGDIPYVWIGPPNWNEDTGINDMLEATCRRGAFFRSAGMEFKRKKDKIHPTREASALWIDSIMRWMPKSSHPILSDVPSDTLPKSRSRVIFIKPYGK